MRTHLNERGIASAIGFLLVLMAVIAGGSILFASWGRTTQTRATGLIDAMRDAEERQNQLLSFVYSDNNAGNLNVYLFNYGSVEAVVDRVWADGNEVAPSNWSIREIGGTELDNRLPPREIVKLIIRNGSGTDNLVTLTESNALYSWRVRGG